MRSQDLNEIVARRNARLAKANAPKRHRSSPATRAQVSEALGIAPRYVIDAVTRALAIGSSGR